MKYIVELKYTNPAHEHVSLRRRVESRNAIVEAANEEQAILRASRQQRALGFMVKEAKIVVPEGFDPSPKDIAAHLVGKHGKGKVTKDHVDAYEKNRDSQKGIDKEAVMQHVQKMSEEVEQLDEARSEVPDEFKHLLPSDTKLPQIKVPKKPGPSKIRKGGPIGSLKGYDRWVSGSTEAPSSKVRKEEVEQIDESTMSNFDAYKLLDRHDDAAKFYDKSGDMAGYKAHAKMKSDITDAILRVGDNMPVPSLLKPKSDKVFSAYPHNLSMKIKQVDDKKGTGNSGEKSSPGKRGMGPLSPKQARQLNRLHKKWLRVKKKAGLAEEVEQIDEMDKSQPSSSRGAEGLPLGKKAEPAKTDKVKSDALKALQKQYKKVKEEVQYIEEKLTAADPASKWISDFVASDNPKFAGKSKKERIRMALGAHYAAKREKNEAVDPDKRDAGYKKSPAVAAAQKKSDELSKVVKRPQAGTLAAVHKSMERELSRNMKKEDKKTAATEKALKAVRGTRNKIDMEPKVETDKGMK